MTAAGEAEGMDMVYEPEEDLQEQEEPDLPLIDTETFYDLLMEQQEQM